MVLGTARGAPRHKGKESLMRSRSLGVVLAAVTVTACGVPMPSPASVPPPTVREPTFTPATISPARSSASAPRTPGPRMPDRFPLPDGAVPSPLDVNDASMIGRWQVPSSGYTVYHFYEAELPRAGYPVAGLYPGDAGAIIRFESDGDTLQVYLVGDLQSTDLVLRRDTP